ncbi:uncharacterized protein LOC135396999 isoform X2 [Ornithodoros turicata]|uniref:uncharacterized protein LOC135396999 isoform X2 n=1 Tax=Ornithodoros turicata TaxID=34597 RepID=UPI003138F265
MDKCEMKTSELDTRHDLSVLPPLLPSAGSSPFHRRFSQLRDQRSAGEEDEDDPWNDRLRAPDFEDVHGFEDDFHLTVIPNFLQDSDAYVAGLEAKLNRVRHTRRQVTAKEMVKALAAESSRLKQDESERDSSESDEYSLFNFWPKIFFPISRRLFPRTALNKSETLPLIKHDVLDEDHSNQISEDSARGEDGSSEQRRRERLDEDQPIVMYERPGASELQIPKEWEDDLARQEEAAQLMAPTGTERSRSALSLSATAAVFPVAEENVSLTGQDKSNDALYHFAYIRASPTSTAESMRVETPIDYHISFVQSSSRFSDRTKKILSPDTSVSSSTSKVQPQRRLSQEQEQTTAFERLSPKSTSSTEEETSQASATLKIKRSTTLSSAPREEAYSSTKESVSAGKTKSEEPFPHSTDDVLPHMSSLVRASIDEEDEIGPTFPLVKSDSESLTSLPKASSSGRCQATADNCEETQESTKPGTESEKSRYSDPHSNIFGESSTELVKEHGSSSLQPVFRMFSSFPQDIHTALQSSIRSWVQQKSVDSSQSQVRDICTASISSLPVAGGTSDIPTKFDGSDRRQYGGTGSELDFQTANTCDSCFGSKVSCKCHCKGKYKAAECVRKKESSGSSVLKYTNQLKSKTSSANSDLNSIPEGCMARKTLSCITDVGSQTTLPSEETTEEQSDEQQVISKLQAGTIGTSSLFKNPQRSVHWFENSAEHSEADTVQHQQNACLSPVSAQGSRTEEQSDFKLDESRPNSTAQASLLPLTTATAQATPTTEVAEEHSAKEDEAALEQDSQYW